MLNPKTPGVYIQEISVLPPSVAPVATAIPAFIGYTEKRGDGFPANTPTRITSFPEYQEIFGGPFDENYEVTLTSTAGNVSVAIDNIGNLSPYLLYYCLQLYFANGGGPCYIVSVGTYNYTSPAIDDAELSDGVDALLQEDEPTLLVVPEAIHLDTGDRTNLHNQMLTQCNTLQDRFALMDVLVTNGNTVKEDGDDFRGEVGMEYLKYGAAYYPALRTTLTRFYQDSSVNINDTRTSPVYNGEALSVVKNGSSAAAKAATGTITITSGFKNIEGETFTIGGTAFTEGSEFNLGANSAETATNLAGAISGVTAAADGNVITLTANAPGVAGNDVTMAYSGSAGARLSGGTLEGGSAGGDTPDLELYNTIKAKLEAVKVTVYPSALMAGVYARVDRNRGVWHAPANVSLTGVKTPEVLVTSEQQNDLNVDASTGKSINVIRTFQGKGILVWGARTLAGNDNEWRYVPVRRLFIFMEESIKKATEPVVFEPNDAKTWLRVKTLIENFLTTLWRDGALAGAAAEDAFFVKVGLGETMTALDILEGRLNIEIGVAAVRPAEFIILKFSHKLQES